jgi:hypothetical protein
MRVKHDRRDISIAGLLLCLLGVYAISPIDYVFRANVGGRNRTVRTCRFDDHDHQDHALDAANLISNSLSNHRGDGGAWRSPAAVPTGIPQPLLAFFGAVPDYVPYPSRAVFLPAAPGRAPPSLS